SDAHRELERVRQQRDLLEPIERHGKAFRAQAEDLKRADRLLSASESYFPKKIIDLFEPEIARRESELERVRAEQHQLKTETAAGQDACRRLKNEIAHAGGERMREIPLLIDKHAAQVASKRVTFERVSRALGDAGISEPISDAATFEAVRAKLAPL